MLETMLSVDFFLSLLTLTLLEIVLGVDNLIFLTIAAQALPKEQRQRAQRLGLLGALVLRIVMLFGIFWIIGLTAPVFEIAGHPVSWRDIILIAGGLFLIWKGTQHIHDEVEGNESQAEAKDTKATSFPGVIATIMVIDVVFALDSIITAVGLTDHIVVMIAANVIAIAVMMFFATPIGGFIERHATVKMLALAFILLVGVALVADGVGFHIPRGYIYFAIAFSLGVEVLNGLVRRKARRARMPKEGI